MSKLKLDDFGIYSDDIRVPHGDKFLFTTKFTDTNGISIFKFFISHRRSQSDTIYLYRHKNPKARIFERKYFLTREEILEFVASNNL